jgi:hypothetical protein
MDTCGSCGASIRWAKHDRTGSRMPFNADPDPDGTLTITHANGEAVFHYIGPPIPGQVALLPTLTRYRSHFATCPHAATHRTAKKEAP